MVATVESLFSPEQMRTLGEYGDERSAAVGDVLFKPGDRIYPLVVILEGEVAILDGSGNEVIRHGASSFVGELNLLTGQTVYLTALVTQPLRYIAVERERLRELLREQAQLGDVLLSDFTARRESLQRRSSVGIEVLGPRTSSSTRALVDYLGRSRIPYVWHDGEAAEGPGLAEQLAGLDDQEIPVVRIPGGADLRNPSPGELSRAIGIGLDLAPHEEADLLIVGGGPAGLAAAVYGASEGLSTLVVESTALGGQAGTSRRIENYLGFPAGIAGSELTSRAVTQARKFNARTASPYRAVGIEPGGARHRVHLEGERTVDARAVVLATGAEYRRLPVEDIHDYEGLSIFYSAGPVEGERCAATRVGVVGGGNSAAQAAIWLARGGAIVTLLHRRRDLHETMSDYLIRDLERYGVEVLDSSEIAKLHGSGGELASVTLRGGEKLPFSFLFLFLGASPCTEWLGDTVRRDDAGFILTGPEPACPGCSKRTFPGSSPWAMCDPAR